MPDQIKSHLELSDSTFKAQFIDCSLNSALFSHEAHLRLAWLLIDELGLDQAEKEIQIQLIKFVEFVGAKDKYHVTLTIASMRMVGHFMRKAQSEDFMDFLQEFPDLKQNFRSLLSAHYSFDIFNSEAAKKQFVEPDLKGFTSSN